MATIDTTKRAAVSWQDWAGPDSSETRLTVAWLDANGRQMAWDLRGLAAFWIAQVFKARDATIDNLRAAVGRAETRELAALAELNEAQVLLWRLRRYEALDDTPETEDAGVELSKAFDDWYARNPDPNPTHPDAPKGERP